MEEKMDQNDVFNLVVKQVCEVIPELKGHKFKHDDQLSDLGANSVDRAEIVTMSMEALSLKFPRVELHGVKNIGELTTVLYEKSQVP